MSLNSLKDLKYLIVFRDYKKSEEKINLYELILLVYCYLLFNESKETKERI